MTLSQPSQTRRHFLRGAALAAGYFALPGALAEELMRKTPWIGKPTAKFDIVLGFTPGVS